MRLIDADELRKEMFDKMCGTGHQAEVLIAISEAPTIDAEPKWIRCEERLPKRGQVVLVTNSKGNVRCGQFRCTDMGYWVWKGNTLETVTAWMPLPKPYMAIEEADDEL